MEPDKGVTIAWLEAAEKRQHEALLLELNHMAKNLLPDLERIHIDPNHPSLFRYQCGKKGFSIDGITRRMKPHVDDEWNNLILHGLDPVVHAYWQLWRDRRYDVNGLTLRQLHRLVIQCIYKKP
jgi:hypothetical protein